MYKLISNIGVRHSRGSQRILAQYSTSSSHLQDGIRLATDHPSDFTIQYPPRREYFKEYFRTAQPIKYVDEIVQDKLENNPNHTLFQKQLLLYCHIPFCEHKCFYCNFAVDTRTNQNSLHDQYVDVMVEGLESLTKYLLNNNKTNEIQLKGIDIGGGTPTILEEATMHRFLKALKPLRDACDHKYPLSIETTPAIAGKYIDRLYVLKEGGVDRISMGVQSSDDKLLEQMNRGKEITLAATAMKNIHKVGFQRVSADIIFGLPNQQIKHWENDLNQIIDLGVDVVTTYDCLYRGKGRAMTKKTNSIPPPEIYGKYYNFAYEFLLKNGFYAPYGSVNFCKVEGETGTSAYFEGRLFDGLSYLGLGNYASSMFDGHWWFAPYSVDQWFADIDAKKASLSPSASQIEQLGVYFPVSDCYKLPLPEMAAKYALLSLSFGVIDGNRFQHIFGRPVEELYHSSLRLAMKNNWMWHDSEKNCYFIVPGQFEFMPQIRSLFYSPSAINWINEIQQNPQRQYQHRRQTA